MNTTAQFQKNTTPITVPFRAATNKPCKKEGFVRCPCCDKPVNEAECMTWVHVGEGGSKYATSKEESDAFENSNADLGCHAVGKDCAKKLAKAGVYVFALNS